jgi:flagellar motor protein MotB
MEKTIAYQRFNNCRFYYVVIFNLIINFNNFNAQNLINNPSFEDTLGFWPKGWEATAWSPDYYSSNFPETYFNNHQLLTPYGKSFVGLYFTEVISTKLTETLVKGQIYKVEIYASKFGRQCPNSLRKLTVAFTKNKLIKKNHEKVDSGYNNKYINLYKNDFKPLNESKKWDCFRALYLANGGEKYFNIGVFGRNLKNSENDSSFKINIFKLDSLEGGNCSYYYIDNVSIQLSTNQYNLPLYSTNVFFEINKSELSSNSYKKLDELILNYNKLNCSKIEIIGYADEVGSTKSNEKLSLLRAKFIEKYFISKGLSKTKIKCTYVGEVKTSNSNKESSKLNRRVDIIIFK